MAQIVVDDLDPVVIEKLTAQAQQHGRSLSAELKAIILQALSPEIAPATSSKIGLETTIQTTTSSFLKAKKREVQCNVPILKEWLEQTEPAPPDFDPDQARWEYLKEKHNL